MSLDEPFPLNLFPSRVRSAILDEFDGLHPSLQEVAAIPDAHWLSTPAIGPMVLKKIRAVGQSEAPPACAMTDADLLRRLTVLQEELTLIQRAVRTVLPRTSREGGSLHSRSLPTLPRIEIKARHGAQHAPEACR
jgi:hypothetical protein